LAKSTEKLSAVVRLKHVAVCVWIRDR